MHFKKQFIYSIVFLFLVSACAKAVVEPPDCGFRINLQFIDKTSGEDLGYNNSPLLDSLNITKDFIVDNQVVSSGLKTSFNYIFEENKKIYFIISNTNFCKQNVFKNSYKDVYVISCNSSVKKDTVSLLYYLNENEPYISFFLNDSLIDDIKKSEIITQTTSLPILQLKK